VSRRWHCKIMFTVCGTAWLVPILALGGTLQVHVRDGRLSVTAEDVPLRGILNEIGRQTGVLIQGGRDPVDEPVSIAFAGLRLEEALQRLVGGVGGYYLVFERGRVQVTLVDRPDRSGDLVPSGETVGPVTDPDPVTTETEEEEVPRAEGLVDPDPPSGDPEDPRVAELRERVAVGDEDALLAALSDPDALVQAAAVEHLRQRDPQSLVAQLTHAAAASDGAVRLQALQQLHHAALEDPSGAALAALAERIHDEDPAVRAFAIEALAASGTAAVPHLRKGLHHPDPELRMLIFQKVVELADVTSESLSLIEDIASDPDPEIRAFVSSWLDTVRVDGG